MEPFDALSDAKETSHFSAHDASEVGQVAMQPRPLERDEETYARQDLRTWEHELPRWLATLNPGRTGHEYEKALRCFFDTPAVPQRLVDISFDLLLAYRGALALRASARDRPRPQSAHSAHRERDVNSLFDPQLATPWVAALPPGDADTPDAPAASPRAKATANGLLAPATVNIRLTALRQFLVHCALRDLLPTLTPDRIRAALRRLSIERRRPYQVLAEPEWGAFLHAAIAPAHTAYAIPHQPSDASSGSQTSNAVRGPWGLSRAERRERRTRGNDATGGNTPALDELGTLAHSVTAQRLSRSRAGLTGARTAQRDHALLSLALATGLRAIELVSLDVGDMVREWREGHEEWWLVLPDAKTKGQRGGRTLPLTPSLVETVLAYLQSTGRRWEQVNDRKTPLFLSHHGGSAAPDPRDPTSGSARPRVARQRPHEGRLSTTQVREIVDRVEAQWLAAQGDLQVGSGIAGESRAISPHALRHSTAVALLEGDSMSRLPASVEHVRGWLGHFDIRTTQGYLAHLDARKHRRPFAIDPNRGERRRDSDGGEE